MSFQLHLLPYLRLMRPANIVTAVADIGAGIAIAGYLGTVPLTFSSWAPVLLLVLATIGLYGGGVVFNDVFDASLDRVERPERPIPKGLVSVKNAAILGSVLLLLGIFSAAALPHGTYPSGLLALAIAAAALCYDKWAKHHPLLGPLNMGLCRGLNLLLGLSILPAALEAHVYLGVIPVLYIAAITAVSRGEVHGGGKATLYTACLLYSVVIASILVLAYANGTILPTVPFLALFAFMIFRPLFRAVQHPSGPFIGKAVKAGVLALILMDGAWAAAFGALPIALLILCLLPLSLWLAKAFAVT